MGDVDCATISIMDSRHILKVLRDSEPELKAAGIEHLRLFGSAARGDSSPQSDIDLLADFTRTSDFTLVTFGCLQSRLTDLLGATVDLSAPEWMREPIRRQALAEAILAF